MKIIQNKQFNRIIFDKRLNFARIGSLDVGTRNIGIAISDPSKKLASPIGKIQRKHPVTSNQSLSKVSFDLQRYIDEYDLIGFVVGFPLNKDGSISPFCREVLNFINRLNCRCSSSIENRIGIQVPVIFTFWDERYTSVYAHELKSLVSDRKSVYWKTKDQIAASIILQNFLDNHSRNFDEENE